MTTRQVSITKVGHSGRALATYPGDLVYRDERVVVARCRWVRPGRLNLGPFCLEQGDIFVEFFYPAEWFNIFRIYSASGLLKGWYCNITEQVEVTGSEVRWRDCALDLLVTPDGRQHLLDEEEFEALHPSAELCAEADEALSTLRCWLNEGRSPFTPRPGAPSKH